MSADHPMHVRFWGVRGSIACPGADFVRYGGNTSCVEVRCGEHLFILDAGTGMRGLGGALLTEGGAIDADILLSHTHQDHIGGIAFFAPCFGRGNALRFWAGGPFEGGDSIEEVLMRSLSEPFLPNLPKVMTATLDFRDFHSGDSFEPRPGVTVKTAPLNHPGAATGYRLEYQDRALAYVTDTEHRPGTLDENILGLIEGADLLIYDATYTDAEYDAHKGWGHSTWQEAVRLAQAASVKRVLLFHHDPSHTDDRLDAIGDEVALEHDNVALAREGMSLWL